MIGWAADIREACLLIIFVYLAVTPVALGLDTNAVADECTTLLAAGSATTDGSIILAKNRDLSEYEVQWLYRHPRESHPEGATVRLQYIEIPQEPVTWAWVGSKSYTKKWGVGMGINEWGVVVADNDAPTREPLEGESGLHDNDVCRLILERSKSAQDGVVVAGAMIEEYGHANVGQIYWIADSEEAWIVECAGRHWAAVKVVNGVAVRANQFQITDSWDEGSEDLVEYAIEQGWCSSPEDFDFARCYSKPGYPYESSQTRLERGLQLLEGKEGNLTREGLMDALEDHYEGTGMYGTAHGNQRYRTICNVRTVSAMVAHLKPSLPREMQAIWYCMSSPCVSVFTPIFANASTIAEPFVSGGAPEDPSSYDEDSAWWVFKRLQVLVDEDYEERHPTIRAMFDEHYATVADEFSRFEGELAEVYPGDRAEARRLMDKFVDESLREAHEMALRAVGELSGVEVVDETQGDEGPRMSYTWVLGVVLIALGLLIYFIKVRRWG
jgi:secernin